MCHAVLQSLVVGDANSSQGQKLLSANSVNSILHPSSPPVEDEVRCVAGWAVGFQRLLSDPDGLRIFKVSALCHLTFFYSMCVRKGRVCVGLGWRMPHSI